MDGSDVEALRPRAAEGSRVDREAKTRAAGLTSLQRLRIKSPPSPPWLNETVHVIELQGLKSIQFTGLQGDKTVKNESVRFCFALREA